MFIKVGKVGNIGSIVNSGDSYNILPAKFQQVEFIGSSGIEFFYIDPFDYNGCVIEFKIRYKSKKDVDKNVFGRVTNEVRFIHGIGWNGHSYAVNYGAVGIRILNSVVDTLVHIWKYDFSGVYLDGVKVKEYQSYVGNMVDWGIFKQPLSLVFFGIDNDIQNLKRRSDVEFYYWKCIKDGIEKISLIPCYNKISGIVGMYDVVNKKFYVNEGEGRFVKGADV